ncbi:MAG: gamma-glutamyl-gamma-aminobutyrate hydrolase family protein [Planctomycetota bacterium]
MLNTTQPTTPTADPVVGITSDIRTLDSLERRVAVADYARAVATAGGTPVFLDTNPDLVPGYLSAIDAFILTGGDDPITEQWGIPTHPKAKRVHPDRQRFELTLLAALDDTDHPVLGVCLGMQYIALTAGGTLDQHLPETTPTHADHWDAEHTIAGDLSGSVHSRHRQAVADAGSLTVAAIAHDGLIEAVVRGGTRYYLGVQWHPERTADTPLGQALFDDLVRSAALKH